MGTAQRWQALTGLEYREHGGLQTGNLLHNPLGLGTDCGGVDGEILDLGELVLTKEHAIEFFSDGPPLASHLRRPGKRGMSFNWV